MNAESGGSILDVVARWAQTLGPIVSGFALVVVLLVISIVLIRRLAASLPAQAAHDIASHSEFIATLQGDLDALRKRVELMSASITALQLENQRLRHQLELMESAHQDLPFPQWLKDPNGIVLAVNRAYELRFLIPRGYTAADYVGHDDFAVWPDEIAREFQEHDRMVFESGVPFVGLEEIEQADGSVAPEVIHKYVRKAGHIKIGISGVAPPMPPRPLVEDLLERGVISDV